MPSQRVETMNSIRIIKSNQEFQSALARLSQLMDLDIKPGSKEDNELELLALLIEDWERKTVPPAKADPIGAILFRMDQQGLSRKDLIPYIGSLSKVSEVLSGKRPLSLAMIRRLHAGLGIPAEILIQEPYGADSTLARNPDLDFGKLPLKEMMERGLFGATAKLADIRDYAEEYIQPLMESLLPKFGKKSGDNTFLRAPLHQRNGRQIDPYKLLAWRLCVLKKARDIKLSKPYKKGTITGKWLRELARLSVYSNGPQLAAELLARNGIALVIMPHFSKTYLDGAAMLDGDTPIVALSLRHNRLDNFWFALMHELAHVARHLNADSPLFVDDLDKAGADRLEEEADTMATQAFIPDDEWKKAPVRVSHQTNDALALADKLGIHPAIVAGRLRHETQNFKLLAGLMNQAEKPAQFFEQ